MSEPTSPNNAPAGWYPAGVDGQERYWDGTQWLETVRPVGSADAPTGAAPNVGTEPAAAPVKKPWYKRPPIIIPVAALGGIIVLGGIIGAINGGDDTDKSSWAEGNTTKTQPQAVEKPAEDTRPVVPALTGKTVADARTALEAAGFVLAVSNGAPDNAVIDSQDVAAGEKRDTGATITVTAQVPMTVAQESAVREAKSYLSFMGFSRAGLTEQMTSEYGAGFSPEDAEFAIATLEQTGQVDWNAEAVEAAKSYMDVSGFSRQGLYEQMTSEYGGQFTPDQANYALDQIGLH